MTEFKDATISFYNRLRGNTTHESAGSSAPLPTFAGREVGVNSDHAAFRMFKAISEKKSGKPREEKPKDAGSMTCKKCSRKLNLPESGVDVLCRCGKVWGVKDL